MRAPRKGGRIGRSLNREAEVDETNEAARQATELISDLMYDLHVFHAAVYELLQKEHPRATHKELGAIMARLTLMTEVRMTHDLLEVPDETVEAYDVVHEDPTEFERIHRSLCTNHDKGLS